MAPIRAQIPFHITNSGWHQHPLLKIAELDDHTATLGGFWISVMSFIVSVIFLELNTQ
jgi:hypothetical protein